MSNRPTDSLDPLLVSIMKDISKLNIPKKEYSPKRQRELFLKKDDPEVFNHLVECHLKFVMHVLKKYKRPQTFDFQDLFMEGVLGLKEAITRYNPEKGFKFSTYAFFWIRKYIFIAIEKSSETNEVQFTDIHYVTEEIIYPEDVSSTFSELSAKEAFAVRYAYGMVSVIPRTTLIQDILLDSPCDIDEVLKKMKSSTA